MWNQCVLSSSASISKHALLADVHVCQLEFGVAAALPIYLTHRVQQAEADLITIHMQ